MNPVDFPQANIIFAAVPGMENVIDVRGYMSEVPGQEECITCHMPSDEERAAIAAGAPIWLRVQGASQPPVSLQVESPFVPLDVQAVVDAARDDYERGWPLVREQEGAQQLHWPPQGDAEMLTTKLLSQIYEELPADVAQKVRQLFADASTGDAAKQAAAIAGLPDEILYNLQPAILVAALNTAMRAVERLDADNGRLRRERNETVDVYAETDMVRLLEAVNGGKPIRLFVVEGDPLDR